MILFNGGWIVIAFGLLRCITLVTVHPPLSTSLRPIYAHQLIPLKTGRSHRTIQIWTMVCPRVLRRRARKQRAHGISTAQALGLRQYKYRVIEGKCGSQFSATRLRRIGRVKAKVNWILEDAFEQQKKN
jgi:hypothetical protein